MVAGLLLHVGGQWWGKVCDLGCNVVGGKVRDAVSRCHTIGGQGHADACGGHVAGARYDTMDVHGAGGARVARGRLRQQPCATVGWSPFEYLRVRSGEGGRSPTRVCRISTILATRSLQRPYGSHLPHCTYMKDLSMLDNATSGVRL